jgi:hypothetical protein
MEEDRESFAERPRARMSSCRRKEEGRDGEGNKEREKERARSLPMLGVLIM